MKKYYILSFFRVFFLIGISIFTFSGLNAQITGKVFIDLNFNGLKETNEPILQGATIRFFKYYDFRVNQEVLCETTTDALGNYSMSPGYFPVRIELVLEPKELSLKNIEELIGFETGHLYGSKDLIFKKDGIHDFGIQVPIGN
ncbi:MAG: hypothetical protein ACM3PT_11745 [Deltaproteobacteria bacterium]|nr:hypothetical protein [Saprospiraceae bacterium]